MAEKPEVNRSQAIRDYYKANPTAKAKEVVDALAKKGITVSVGLVNIVKSKHNKAHAAKKAVTSQAKSVDKKPEVNKTQAVRDYLKAHKTAKNAEVVDALAKQGITITVGYVRTIKAKHNTRRRAVKQVVAAVAPTGVGIPEIKAAFAFLKAVGSVAVAKQALTAAVEIKAVV